MGTPGSVASIIGGNQTICADNTTISATAITEGNGVWTVVSGPNTPTIDNPSSESISVTNLFSGSYVFRWTVSSTSPLCPDSTDEITVDVSKPATSAGANQNLCEVNSVFLEATEGTTGTWSIVSVDGDSSPGATAPYTPSQSPSNSNTANAAVDAGSTYIFRYTTDYVGCSNVPFDVTVTVSNGPSVDPDAGDDQDICLATTSSATLTTGYEVATVPTIPGDVTSTWQLVSPPGGATVTIVSPVNSP